MKARSTVAPGCLYEVSLVVTGRAPRPAMRCQVTFTWRATSPEQAVELAKQEATARGYAVHELVGVKRVPG